MSTIEVLVQAIRMEADGILSFELRSASGSGVSLPGFTAGAHIDVHMREGLSRSYSLVNDPEESDRYIIAVNLEANGRGGARLIHAPPGAGGGLRNRAPRHKFPPFEAARHTVLIAGGIGITPMLSMIDRLSRIGRPWTLHYCGRSRRTMAYLAQLEARRRLGADVRSHIDVETGGRFIDLTALVADAPDGAHFYCCGPTGMLAAFEAASGGLPEDRVHVEYFAAREASALDGGFVVELRRDGRELTVLPGKSILDTLLEAGVSIEFSCMEGICGSCEVKVLAGVPDHRDSVLSGTERAANDRMLICCSGSKSSKLVLDL